MKQSKLLKDAKAVLGWDDARMAQELGVSVKSMQSWQADESASHYRNMSETARLLLARIVKDAKK